MLDDLGPAESRVIRIPIREDLRVAILDLPFDMTLAEATKIANVIIAFAEEPTE